MKKMIMVAFLFMMGLTVANAQGVRFGAKAGANFSSATGDGVSDISVRTGLNIGAVVNIPVSELLSVQPEVTYSMRGYKDGAFTIRLDYVDVPILADFEVIDGLNLQGGPLIGINLSATNEDEHEPGEIDIEDVISTLNAAVAIGAQYELPMGFFFQVRYDIGFNDIIDNEGNAKNANFSAAVGYFFN